MSRALLIVLVILAVVLVVIVGLVVWAVGINNQLVVQEQNVNASWAQVQNQYQRRNDLIDNLVKTVAGAANFEGFSHRFHPSRDVSLCTRPASARGKSHRAASRPFQRKPREC